MSKLTTSGITTVVGLFGTDGISRSVKNLLSKAKALKQEGMNVYILSGSYQYPSATITGDIKKDIMFIDEIIGCKLALSDYRSTHISTTQLTMFASEVCVSALLSNKPGILIFHMGDEKSGLKKIFKILDKTDLSVALFHPTHVTRNDKLLTDAIKLLKIGGYIDLNVDDNCLPAIKKIMDLNLSTKRVTISSDGQGS